MEPKREHAGRRVEQRDRELANQEQIIHEKSPICVKADSVINLDTESECQRVESKETGVLAGINARGKRETTKGDQAVTPPYKKNSTRG